MQSTPIERNRFYKAILDVYSKYSKLTARECAEKLLPSGLIIYPTRQSVQPRIVEMVDKGLLESVGSKIDIVTKKKVTIYRKILKEANNG